jgi:hypothetical protein
MIFSLSRWRPRHLLASWLGYWAALILVAIGPAIPAIWRVTRPDAHGSISANFGDGVLKLIVLESGTVVWEGAVRVLTATLWLGVPPLLLWLAWVVARSRARTPTPTTPRPV